MEKVNHVEKLFDEAMKKAGFKPVPVYASVEYRRKKKAKIGFEELEKKVEALSKKKEEKRKKERLEEQRRERESKRFWENEKKLSKKKEELYNQISSWANTFSKTKQFKNLFDEYSGEITLYYGSWGHEPNGNDHGCWSRICMQKSGKLRYWAGYKWMPSGPRFTITRETIDQLTHKYLKELYSEIKSGRVYDTIADRLKDDF